MAKNYVHTSGVARRKVLTPQTQRVNERQVQNNAGGYVYKVDGMEQLRRFLILGTSGGTFYVSEKKLTKDNAKNIADLFKNSTSGIAAVDEIVRVSDEGLAVKNDPAIFALALAASCENDEVRKYALANLSKVCRISTFLFTFVSFCDSLRGWGRGLRNAIADWYLNMPLDNLAYQVCKYPQRRVEGELPWSHRDLLRKTHLTPNSAKMNTLFKYIVEGRDLKTKEVLDSKTKKRVNKTTGFTDAAFNKLKNDDVLKYVWAHEEAKKATSAPEIVTLINDYRISRESIPNNLFTDKVWMTMLENGMPMTAMIRNIRNMTKSGVLAPLSHGTELVVNALSNEAILQKARIHPVSMLAAINAYAPNKFAVRDYWGYGYTDNSIDYTPVPQILDAMEAAFYKSFKNVESTGKNIVLGVDISGSMLSPMPLGIKNMSCTMGAAAMAMVIARTEKNSYIMGFADYFKDLGISANDSLETVMSKCQGHFGGTDTGIPVKWALQTKTKVDCFVTLSDMEAWCDTHTDQLMKKYRSQMNLPEAKSVAIGMTSNSYTINDPEDKKGSLNCVGFSTDTPQVVSSFIRGDF